MGKHVHRLSELDTEERTATCANCGPVKVKGDGKGRFRCAPAAVAKELARRQMPGHKEHYQAWQKDYHARTQGYAQRKALLKQYGITPEQYDEMLEAQGWACKTCSAPAPKSRDEGVRFPVDHCHETGVNRGILCPSCNRALGLVGDNPATMRRLAEHVEEFRTAELVPGG